MRNLLFIAAMASAALPCWSAEPYPVKSVRVIVPFGPGGGTDLAARLISQQLSEQLGRPFVVENRTGAGGTIANGIVAKSTPDGYTLMLMDTSTAIAPGLYKSLGFDVVKDFAPITQILGAPLVVGVHPSLNAATLKEFVALARANPGKFNYSTGGVGTINHLSAELFNRSAKVDIAHVPFKGGGEMVTSLLGGQVQMLIATIPTVLAFVNSGKVRALAVTTAGKRSPSMPDVPSISEAGVPGMAIYTWYGLVGPSGMPPEVVRKLHAEVVKAIAVPGVNERFIAQGSEMVGSGPEEFSRHIRSEVQRWAEVVKSAGIAPE